MRKALPILVILALLAGTTGTLAQETPTMRLPYTPVAEDCQITPRSVEEILALTGVSAGGAEATGASAASPAAAGSDPAADQVLVSIQELAACIVSGDTLRTFALFSDGYLERLEQHTGTALEDDILLNAVWAIQGQIFLGDENWAEILAGYLGSGRSASPVPGEAGVTGTVLAVPAVWELGAGRMAAAVTVQGLSCFMQCDYVLVFVHDEDSGRYLIDEAIEVFDLSEIPSG